MNMIRMRVAGTTILMLMLAAGTVRANNLQITNVTVVGRDDTTAYVQFDLQWENSWRYPNINHDAAWVFFKVLPNSLTDWQHVTLEGTGTNPPDYKIGSGTAIEMVVPSDRVGMFVRRSGEGEGLTSVQNVKAVWNFASNGLIRTDKVRVQALAVEMVYVAEGPFWIGNTNATATAGFHAQGISNSPAYIASTDAFTIYWGASDVLSALVPAAFPNGYAAFYCMKYEITQGLYTDFLNLLTTGQATNRYSSASTGYRYTIGTNAVGYTNGAPDRACNYLSWADGCAFADWAGLRPMTELEFEKACRGPLVPVANEFAWGDSAASANAGTITNDGTGNDMTGGNCNYITCSPDGPYRVGIYATASSSRQASGASYWGIMELSGNVWERAVTVGQTPGLLFTGALGNGGLDAKGDADVNLWPSASGAGARGGSWEWAVNVVGRVADRSNAASTSSYRAHDNGWRGVRKAP